jgi:hypothetical protein
MAPWKACLALRYTSAISITFRVTQKVIKLLGYTPQQLAEKVIKSVNSENAL